MTELFATGWNTKRRLAALVGAALMLAASAGSAARAADDDDEAPDTKLIRSILHGLGLRRGDEASIDYRERSPLVVPATRDLPPPETAAPEARNPDWPVDPEVKEARRASARADKRGGNSDWVLEESRTLTPDQLNVPQPTRSRDSGSPRQSASESAKPMSPTALGYVGGLFGSMFGKKDEEQARFTGEPTRTSLTAPPPGYQTPSPNQPYGLGKGWDYEKQKAFDPMDQPARGDH